MRWFIRSLVALALLWAVYLLSPYVALYNLAKALEARDVALIEAGSFLTTANLRRLWSLTEWRGFRVFLVRLPQDGTEEPLQLQFRLAGLTWRLSGLDLPQELKDRLVRDLAARQSAGK